MTDTSYSFSELSQGSKLVRDLVSRDKAIEKYVSRFYDPAEIPAAVASRSFSDEQRAVLVKALKDQNQQIATDLSKQNFDLLLKDNTFTITTGHQLNLLTGPLYSVVKIAQVIAISKALSAKYTNHQFVPVFWMASEDHDFEEINHINLFGKKISWNKTDQQGSIAGEMKTTDLALVFDEISALFREDAALKELERFRDFYLSAANLAEATRRLVTFLFGAEGLVIIDGNDKSLKELLKPVLLREVEEEVTYNAVSATNALLEKEGYHLQVFVRNCNLFFIHADGRRERIVKENDEFTFNGKSHSLEQVKQLIAANPAIFSPNALLRPVYQELILPNIVNVGGAGEIAYWLQLKGVFDQLKVPFPMLRVRDSIIMTNQKNLDELSDLGLTLPDLLDDVEVITKSIARQKSGNNLDMSDALADIMEAKSKVLEKTIRVDKNLATLVEAEFSKMISSIEKIESKLVKAEKDKDQNTGNKVLKLQERLFHAKGLRERHDNFLPFYLANRTLVNGVITLLDDQREPRIKLFIS